VPVILLVDVDGKAGTVPPAHMANEVPKPNTGVVFGLTVTTNVIAVAHNPGDGVKV
jgi:hypothetical protein